MVNKIVSILALFIFLLLNLDSKAQERNHFLNGKVIDHTEDRSVMWNAQTPQIFRSKRLQHAYENFSGDYSNATDEAAIFDELEDDVVLYENSSNNLKITLSDDLKLAEFMMKEKNL